MKYVFAFGAILLWSSNALVASHALVDLAVHQLLLLQFSGAALVFLIIKQFDRPARKTGLSAPAVLLGFLGLTGTISLQYVAFYLGPITQTNVVGYAWPLVVALAAITMRQVARPFMLLLCAIAGFIGVALVIGTPPFEGVTLQDDGLGYAAAAASALCMATYTIMIGRLDVAPTDALLPGALLGGVATLLISVGGSAIWPWSWSLLLGLYLGIGPMGIGYYLWSRAMQRDAQGTLALLGYLTPVISTILLLIFLDDAISRFAMIGIIIVLASCIQAAKIMLAQDHAAAV